MGRIGREPLAALERLCRVLGLPFDATRFAEAGRPVYASNADKSRTSGAMPEIRAALSREIKALGDAFPDIAAELEAEAANLA